MVLGRGWQRGRSAQRDAARIGGRHGRRAALFPRSDNRFTSRSRCRCRALAGQSEEPLASAFAIGAQRTSKGGGLERQTEGVLCPKIRKNLSARPKYRAENPTQNQNLKQMKKLTYL